MNWMACHEDRMQSAHFGDAIEDVKPVIAKGSSDSAALDSVFELMLHGGREVPMVKSMMIPQAINVDGDNGLLNYMLIATLLWSHGMVLLRLRHLQVIGCLAEQTEMVCVRCAIH